MRSLYFGDRLVLLVWYAQVNGRSVKSGSNCGDGHSRFLAIFSTTEQDQLHSCQNNGWCRDGVLELERQRGVSIILKKPQKNNDTTPLYKVWGCHVVNLRTRAAF